MKDNYNFWEMEDNLDILENGRRPHFLNNMEDNLNFLFFVNGRRLQPLGKMKDGLIWLAKWKITSIFMQNGRQLQFVGKIKDEFNFSGNGR